MPQASRTAGLRTRFLSLLLLAFSAGASAAAGVQGEIRFEPAGTSAPWVGQEVELNLELWSDAFSFGDQLWVLPEVKGGYLMQADSSTIKLSEDRDGIQWQGLRYTLLVFPQRAGRIEVPAFEVQFTARAGYGSEPAPFRYQTPVLNLEARLPPGVTPGGLLVTTEYFNLESSWTPEVVAGTPVELKVGDALTLQVTRQARDVPGMVFAPLPRLSLDGIAAYPDVARVDDRINRGALTGNRADSITFICEREGRYSIPEFRFQWWDPSSEQLSESVIPAVDLLVAANPVLRGGAGYPSRQGFQHVSKPLLMLLVVLLLAGGLAWWKWSFLSLVWHERRAKREAGEDAAFRKARKACAANSAADAYNAINAWLGHHHSAQTSLTLSRLAARSDDPALAREARLLQEHVISENSTGWSGHELLRLLEKYRKSARVQQTFSCGLAPLNPPMIR